MTRAAADRLWAPWRRGYLMGPRKRGCIFCAARRSRRDRAAHVLRRGPHAFCLLNRYPYNAGHLMVVVNRHVGDLSRLTPQERADLMGLTDQMVSALRRVLRPQGFNIGMNLGRAAGAGIPGHVHLHVVPRWAGDVNFMSAVNGTRVVSTSLETLYTQLKRSLAGKLR